MVKIEKVEQASWTQYEGEVNGMYFLAHVDNGYILSMVVGQWVVSMGEYQHHYTIRGQGSRSKVMHANVQELLNKGWLKQS